MPSPIPTQLVDTLTTSVEDVFTTMVFQPVQPGGVVGEVPRLKQTNIVATVAFAGHRRGAVSFHSSADCAKDIAGSMLGITPAEINGELPDAIGEIANMIAGTFRTKLAAFEPACAISVPTVTMGSDFATRYVAEVSRTVIPFTMSGQTLWVELILTGQ
ncbi:MAG TPA: chemotaxis protein CheX [Vicinamibacterales bacterium]|nr:chemotaxis protein CheX [Vicinamibacterales bacterium]